MAPANFIWRKFEWECQGQPYKLEVSQDGVRARLSSGGGGRSPETQLLVLPMTAWAAISDAIRQTHAQERRADLPARAGKFWTKDEVDKVVAAFQAGKTIEEIATLQSRTPGAIISKLAQVGLIDRETFVHPPPSTAHPGPEVHSASDHH